MKIISKHRDYYDNIAFMYGGGDPKIRYERDSFKSTLVELPEQLAPKFPRYCYTPRNISFQYLVICDKWFPLYYDCNQPQCGYRLMTNKLSFIKEVPKWARHYWDEFQEGPIEGNDRLLNLTREVGNPVYVIKHVEDFVRRRSVKKYEILDHFTPLFDYGIQELYPAEQIYQDIAYFVSNILNDSPDLQPKGKPPQTDKEKIIAHGMDLKTSFRGKQ